jgi:ABC-2 type transport system permease protein
MSTSITEPQNQPHGRPSGGPAGPELAPSRLREDELGFPRTLGMAGAVLVFASTVALILHTYDRPLFGIRVNAGWALVLMVVGMGGLLYHAAFDREVMFRRLYLVFAIALMLVGVVLCLIRSPKEMGDQLRFGAPALLVALLFFVASLRNETDESFRKMMESILGAAGALMAVTAVIMLLLISVKAAEVQPGYLRPLGLVLGLFGLVYLTAFVNSRGISDDYAYYAALALAGVGLLLIVIAVARTLVSESAGNYFTSVGVLLIMLGLIYAVVGGGLAADFPLLIMLRRELGAFFLSPITYLVLVAFCVIWAVNAGFFFQRLFPEGGEGGGMVEPIVAFYVLNIFPIFTAMLAAPVLTMGTFSEEQRSGTMEVLLTAPVSETQILTSKFLAALIAYMLAWVPAGLYLLALLIAGANGFDYRPLLSFFIQLTVWGAAFVSMGIFFSSLTKQMLIAAVLSFAGMMAWTFLYIVAENVRDKDWGPVLSYLSYIHAWESGLEGKVVPRFLLFPTSMTVLFLFLTHKVLESRKWR